MRSNIHAGGKLAAAAIDDQALHLAEIVRPKLVQDGMFLIGLDIVGDKLMEINVFSPGGLGSAQKFTKVNFCRTVIDALERKVSYRESYGRNFGNVDMSTRAYGGPSTQFEKGADVPACPFPPPIVGK
jgi:glutathione synthase